MARYSNLTLNWVTFSTDKEKAIVEMPCEIVLVPGKMLTVSYREPGLAKPTIWKGDGNVTFNLKRESPANNMPGTATMHYISNRPRLEGFWSEGPWTGCWWVEIDEDPE